MIFPLVCYVFFRLQLPTSEWMIYLEESSFLYVKPANESWGRYQFAEKEQNSALGEKITLRGFTFCWKKMQVEQDWTNLV